jgi:DegV family protein with EDD domain
MSQFTIVVDTSCDLPQEYLKQHNIEVVPIPFTLDGAEHSQGSWQEISGKDFYTALRNGGVAKTTQINPDTYVKSFNEFIEQGREALYIILSSGLSGTFQSAVMALDEVRETHPECGIYLIDSLCATSLNSLLAVLAVKQREEGKSARDTAAYLEEKKNNTFGFFTVDDLMYLHRGGRLSKLSAIGGSLLGIKPVLTILPNGTLTMKEKVRGRTNALKTMINQLKRCVEEGTALDTVYISHTDCEADAMKLAEMVKEAVNTRHVEIELMGPVIGAHVGPGAVTLVFEGSITRADYESKYHGKKSD